MMAKPIKTLKLHYPMIQFLIIKIISGTFLKELTPLPRACALAMLKILP